MSLFQNAGASATNCITNADGSVTITMSETRSVGIDPNSAIVPVVIIFLAVLIVYFLFSRRRSDSN